MTAMTWEAPSRLRAAAQQALQLSVICWCSIAFIGLWLFAYYVLSYYGRMIWAGGFAGLNESHLPKAYIAGDVLGNLAIAGHLLIAVIVLGGGPLQLIPAIRQRFPKFHRYNGRAFLVAAVIAAISGLYMVWVRGSVGDLGQHIGISLNAVLILAFATFALQEARARRIANHRRWALRLFLATNGVWFARIGLWLWVYLTGGAGIDFKSFTGPFLTFLNFAQYLLPLLVLELYFLVQSRGGTHSRFAMTGLFILLSAATAVGTYQAATTIWLPRA